MMLAIHLLRIIAITILLGHTAVAADFAVDASRLNNSAIRYRDHAQITDFPVPAIAVRRVGLSAGAEELTEIKEKILCTLIEHSQRVLSSIVLEWYPGQPNVLGVIILYSDGDTREALIPRSPQGTYATKAYEVLLAKPTP